MPSLRAKLVNAYLRRTMKPKALYAMDVGEFRQFVEEATSRTAMFLPKNVECEAVAFDGLVGEWHKPKNARADRTILFLHGGGYVFSSPKTHRSLTYALSTAAQANVFSLDYRLAPEHPCPAAIEDAVAAYNWLVASGRDPSTIILAGDSAGGGLVLATLLALKERGVTMPAGALLYSPWTDFTLSGASLVENAEADAMFMAGSIEKSTHFYQGDIADPADSRLSPLFGDFMGLPPLKVFASDSEMLRDDSVRLVERARAAGVSVEFDLLEGLAHVWPVLYPLLPEAKQTIGVSAAFCDRLFPEGEKIAA